MTLPNRHLKAWNRGDLNRAAIRATTVRARLRRPLRKIDAERGAVLSVFVTAGRFLPHAPAIRVGTEPGTQRAAMPASLAGCLQR